jgi:hypothetical protein
MTGIVLALAGLSAGDGGPGMEAAKAPAVFSLHGHWRGHRVEEDLSVSTVTVWEDFLLLYTARAVMYGYRYTFNSDRWGEGRFRWADSHLRPAIYKLEGDRFFLCVSRSNRRPTSFTPGEGVDLYVLKPVAPHKR